MCCADTELVLAGGGLVLAGFYVGRGDSGVAGVADFCLVLADVGLVLAGGDVSIRGIGMAGVAVIAGVGRCAASAWPC